MEFPMNTLNIIKRQIDKAEALRRAQLSHTSYRGIPTQYKWMSSDRHGEFTYRGVTYTK